MELLLCSVLFLLTSQYWIMQCTTHAIAIWDIQYKTKSDDDNQIITTIIIIFVTIFQIPCVDHDAGEEESAIIIISIIIIIIFVTIFQIPCVDHGAGEEKAANNTFPRRINIKPLPPKNKIPKKKNWKLNNWKTGNRIIDTSCCWKMIWSNSNSPSHIMDVRRFPVYCYCASRFKFTIFTSRLSTAHLINVVTWRVYLLRDETHKCLFFHPVVCQAVHLHHSGG